MLSTPIVLAVLAAAALHASWNVMVRAAGDRRRETALVVGAGAVLALVVLPFMPALPLVAWPYLAASAVLNAIYFVLLSEAYARGGVSLAYPLMRGVAPMLTLCGAWVLFREALPGVAWLGIGAICGGVAALAKRTGSPDEVAAMEFALANAVVIAAYTLNDAAGVRLSQAPLTYVLTMYPLTAVPTLIWMHRGIGWRRPSAAELRRGFGGATCMIGAYAIALWAMTHTPVAPVAALRETAILFGLLLARVLLGERPGRRGWAGGMAIAAGAAILQLA
jgi:drug/metabolite transporter (DMT)-like permease